MGDAGAILVKELPARVAQPADRAEQDVYHARVFYGHGDFTYDVNVRQRRPDGRVVELVVVEVPGGQRQVDDRTGLGRSLDVGEGQLLGIPGAEPPAVAEEDRDQAGHIPGRPPCLDGQIAEGVAVEDGPPHG